MAIISEKLFELIAKCHRDPFCILSSSGEIIFSNQHCKNLLRLNEDKGKVTDYLAPDSAYNFELLLDTAAEKNNIVREGNYILKLQNGEELKSEIILNPFEDDGKLYILCTIIPRFFAFEITGESRFSIETGDVAKISKDQRIENILNQISVLYPLTFVGKEIIHKQVNDLDEYFWLKDNKGKFLIANNVYAASFGLKPNQLEGKHYENFIPAYMINFYNALYSFINDTHHSVVIDGIPLKDFKGKEKRELVVFPLTNNDDTLIAQVGLTRKKVPSIKEENTTGLFDALFNLIDFFPKPVAFIDERGRFKHTSKDFSKLFAQKFKDLTKLSYTKVFSEELSQIIKNFVNSNNAGIVIDINENLEVNKAQEPDYKLILTKYYRKENLSAGFSVYLEKIEYFDTLQKIIKSKGRMFEILIKNNPSPIFIYDKENLRFLEVNDAALKLYGYTKDEFLLLDLTDLYSPEDIQSLLGTSDEKFEEGVFSEPLRHKKKDGSNILVEMSKIAFKFNDRDAHFNIIRDISEKKELDKKIQLFKAAFDNTSNLIFVTDKEGIINFANDAAEKLLMVQKSDLKNSSLTSFCADEDRALLNTSVFQSHLKDNATLEIKLKRSDGALIETVLTSVPVLDINSEVESFSIIAVHKQDSDFSGEPREIIKEVIKEVVVEKPVQSQTSSGPQLDQNFLSGVFHEILTPMNVILGFAQELTEGTQNATQEQKEAADIINQNRFTLLSTMNSIIEFSDILFKRSGTEVNEIGITEIIENLDKNIKEISGSESIDFSYGKISSSLRFKTDKKMFESLIGNLIRLIGKVTKENKIYFSAYSLGEESFLISISDKYGTTSESLQKILHQLFTELKDPKELGVSKLTAQISKTLLSSINGEYISFTNNAGRTESGFKFPVDLELRADTFTKPGTIESDPEQIKFTDENEIKDEPVLDETQSNEEIEIEEDVSEELPSIPEPEPVAFTEPVLPEAEPENNLNEDLIEEESFEEEINEPELDEVDQVEEEIAEEVKEEQIESELEITEPFTIPQEKQEALKSELDLSSLKCLYIEDQVDSQILFKVQMKGLAEIKFAASFEEAAPLLESNKFDFIVMDINLQGEYNGLDALKIIHKMPGLESIPIIAVTAYVLPGDKEKFIATGFNDFISKPIFREKMVESLNKIFVTH